MASFPSPRHLQSRTPLNCVRAHPDPQCVVILDVFLGVACVAAQKDHGADLVAGSGPWRGYTSGIVSKRAGGGGGV